MNISGINYESVVDGQGIRVVVYVSGCAHNCEGCHNPSSHPFDAGIEFSEKLQDDVIKYVKDRKFISGITISGGDPMYSADEVSQFVSRFKEEVPDASVWIYSGFRYEYIITRKNMANLLYMCDVLVDGKFVLECRDMTLPYRGSQNQRVIDIQKTREIGKVVLFK